MGKDFRAAFSNMNKAVRPGAEQPVEQPVMHNIEQPAKQPAKKKKMSLAEKRNEINTIPCTWFPKYNTRNMSIVTNRLVMDVMVQKKTLIFLYTVGRTGKYTLTPHSQTQIKAIPHKERTAKRTKKGYNKEVKKQFKEQNE